jgi:hypothetical protein
MLISESCWGLAVHLRDDTPTDNFNRRIIANIRLKSMKYAGSGWRHSLSGVWIPDVNGIMFKVRDAETVGVDIIEPVNYESDRERSERGDVQV